MNKSTIVLLSAIACALAGCAQTTPATHIAEEDPELTCGNRTVTVFQATGFLAVYPEYIDVCTGYNITINVVPPVADGGFSTAPESGNPGEDSWLDSTAKRGGSAIISVPPGIPTGVYKYSITVEGVGTLDPRARVVK